MTCPHCESTATTERLDRTELGYRRFHYRACQRAFNERTGTAFNRLRYPSKPINRLGSSGSHRRR
jgi:transposase-like protein